MLQTSFFKSQIVFKRYTDTGYDCHMIREFVKQSELHPDGFEFTVTESEIIDTYNLYQDKKYIETWGVNEVGTKRMIDVNTLYFITISRKNSSNLLVNLIDSYGRHSLNQTLKEHF